MGNHLVVVFGIWSCVLQFMVLHGSADDCVTLPGEVVDCSYRNFSAIPNKTLPNTTHSLDLSHNSLHNVTGYAFHSLTELVWLDLSFNRISKLDPHAFLNLSNLEFLNLNSNDLLMSSGTYPLNVFQSLVNLKIFHVEDNPCFEHRGPPQYPEAMSALTALEEFYTDFPPFVTFTNKFSKMTKLKTLASNGFGLHNKRHDKCCVKTIQRTAFISLTKIPIRHFRLADSCLTKIDPDAFEPFRNLTSLELEGNRRLGLHNALQSFKGLVNRTITHINLRGCNDFTYKQMLDFKLNTYSLRFLCTVCVQSLKISENYLVGQYTFHFTRPGCLQELDMSVHSFHPKDLCKVIITHHRVMHNLSKLNISNHVGPPPVHHNGDFQLVSDRPLLPLTHLDLSFLPMRCVFYSEQLQTVHVLNISGWNCTIVDPSMFSNMRNITELSMRKTSLDLGLSRHYLKGSIFRNLALLERVDLSDNQLTFIPQDLFLTNHKLKSLSLENNNLPDIPTQAVDGTALELLDLSSNAIQWLSSDDIQFLENQRKKHDKFKIFLNANPFVCSCSSVHFLQWLNQTSMVSDLGNTFLCRFPNGSQGRIVDFMKNFKVFSVSCVSKFWLTISIAVSLVIIPLLICFIGYYRRRWNIHYWFYTHCKPTDDMLPEQNYKYDAFVAYNHNDCAWVHNNLREHLEAPNTGLSLCLHHRDFEAGQAIQQNIVDSTNNSRKIILVISHEFIKSTWGEYEIEMAAMRSVQEARTDVIACVLLEDIPIREMPRSLMNLWQRVTFLAWPNTLHDQDLFWDRLSNALF